MRTRALLAGTATLVALVLTPPTLQAQDITIGGPYYASNAFPFGSYFATWGSTRYQQVYNAALFPSTVSISAVRFHGGNISTGGYEVWFSATPQPVNGLSTNYDANVGSSGLFGFFSGALGPSSNRIVGDSPYVYDPAEGNLLMDVRILSQENDGTGHDFAISSTDGTSRVFTSAGTTEDDGGLITTFETAEVGVVPEPLSLLLLGTGLAGVGAVRRRRARADD